MSETSVPLVADETTPEAYILPAAVRDAILTYLGNRPYREVASGFQALLDLKQISADVGDKTP